LQVNVHEAFIFSNRWRSFRTCGCHFVVLDHASRFLQVNAHEAFIFSNGWSSSRTASGTVTDGELWLNQSGLWLISEENGDDSVSS
jgi:hypothetical protein